MQQQTEYAISRPEIAAGIVADNWYAVNTRPRYEKKVADALKIRSVNVFLPLFSENHRWSDRRKIVHIPLFAGYVFVRLDSTLESRIPVLRTPGALGFVGVRGAGVPIPEDQIEAVQTLLAHGVVMTPHMFLQVGKRVRIRGGSLDGLRGILLAKNGDLSLVISVESIQRSVEIRVAGYDVVPE
jgi:transcription antitermination factor NusG